MYAISPSTWKSVDLNNKSMLVKGASEKLENRTGGPIEALKPFLS